MRKVIDRRVLKNGAKLVLKRFYWPLFFVSFIGILICGNGNGSTSGGYSNYLSQASNSTLIKIDDKLVVDSRVLQNLENIERDGILHNSSEFIRGFYEGFTDALPEVSYYPAKFAKNIFSFIFGALALFLGFGAIVFSVLVSFPVKVGCKKVFINSANAKTKPRLRHIWFVFQSGRYLNAVCAGLLTGLYTFLWSLLFVIPGIVKGYAYSMVPCILAENPHMSASDAIRLSVEMTRGHKWDIFIMDCSFIGWYLLGTLAFGLGGFFVRPYHDATLAQMYLALRDNALDEGIAVPRNFRMAGCTAEPDVCGIPQSKQEEADIVDYRDKPFEN